MASSAADSEIATVWQGPTGPGSQVLCFSGDGFTDWRRRYRIQRWNPRLRPDSAGGRPPLRSITTAPTHAASAGSGPKIQPFSKKAKRTRARETVTVHCLDDRQFISRFGKVRHTNSSSSGRISLLGVKFLQQNFPFLPRKAFAPAMATQTEFG